MNRREWLALLGAGAIATPFGAHAQQQGKLWRIGYIDFGSRQSTADSGRYAALMQGLRELGYIEGKNMMIDARFADGDLTRVDGFAVDLVRQKVDLLLTLGSAASHAAQRATSIIPIVVISSPDPVHEGFAATLARPGGNITGMSNGADDTIQKLLEMLNAVSPKLARIAVLVNPANAAHTPLMAGLKVAAQKTGKQILPMNVSTPEEIQSRFVSMTREKIGGVIILADAFFFQQRAQIATLALKHRLPSIYALAGYAEAGGLMSYGADNTDNFRRAGIFVDKILKGAKPGELPFEQPSRYYLMINRQTAKTLGIQLSQSLLLQADKVID